VPRIQGENLPVDWWWRRGGGDQRLVKANLPKKRTARCASGKRTAPPGGAGCVGGGEPISARGVPPRKTPFQGRKRKRPALACLKQKERSPKKKRGVSRREGKGKRKSGGRMARRVKGPAVHQKARRGVGGR